MSKWEKFTHRQFKSFSNPRITITKDGHLSINFATMNEYVKDNSYAVLYYNKSESLIGIKFYKRDKPEAYKIRKYRDGKLGYITIIAFLKYYRLKHNKTESYVPEWNTQEELLIVNLKKHEQRSGKSKQILGQDI